PGRRLRASHAARGAVARSPGLGREGAHPEGNAPARSAGAGSDQRLRGPRVVPRHVARRGAPAVRPAQPDPDPGAAARAYAGRGKALHLRPRHAAHDPVRAPRAARVAVVVRAPGRRPGVDLRSGAACRFFGTARTAEAGLGNALEHEVERTDAEDAEQGERAAP